MILVLQFLSMILVQAERAKGFITSGVQFIFYLLLLLAGIIPFYDRILDIQDSQDNPVSMGLKQGKTCGVEARRHN